MKILSLNVWGGRMGERLLDFFKTYAATDVFLLQEMMKNATELTCWEARCRPHLFREVQAILPAHEGRFAPTVSHEWGLASFIKREIVVENAGDIFIHKHRDAMINKDGSTIGRNIQYHVLTTPEGKRLNLLNFHGIWTGNGKTDTPDRLTQSAEIIKFIRTLSGEVILAGDFNLLPSTESLKLLMRETGFKNLIAEYGITSTRTSLYTKPDKYADYIFVSPGIAVKDFRVLPEEASDHAALLLEI